VDSVLGLSLAAIPKIFAPALAHLRRIAGGRVAPMSRTNRKADRDLLIALTASLCVSKGRLRRDPCGDWVTVGTRGHFLTDGISAFAYVPAGTARRWEKAKRILNFMAVTQDGDEEGILKLIETPTTAQAGAIRKLLGLRKASPLSHERRAALVSVGFSQAKPPVQAGFIDLDWATPTNPPSDTQTSIDDAEIPLNKEPDHERQHTHDPFDRQARHRGRQCRIRRDHW
jgi:hypothetical protein